ncbi:sugar ABC transporter permease, partial [Desulfovibrio sp.]|uniref:carbohydrate ABC transporter permease n=1 Tax=Desulfovibrio sp. TaxID=885 RepID=UPI002617A9AA
MRWLSDRHTLSEQLSGWLFVLPMLGLFVFFFGWPIIKTVCYLGLTKYGMIGEPQWIGLANYQKLFFQDPNAKSVLFASIRIPLMLIPIHVVLSLPLAWLVFSCRNRLARSVARTTLYVPTLVTTGAVAVAWNFIFSTDNGPLNYVLQQLGLIGTKIPWLIK